MFGFFEWRNPLIVASNLASEYSGDWVFLHSSLIQKNFSRYSIIAFNPSEKIKGSSFAELKKKLTSNICTGHFQTK